LNDMENNRRDLSDTKSNMESCGNNSGHISVLYGVRAVSILIVVWYHFWQQSWLMPIAGSFNIDWVPRNGALLVDMMILLSGFCLFLPYAREMVTGKRAPGAVVFYVKRVARILPSYYISVLIVLCVFALPLGKYMTTTDMWKDLVPHLFLVHNFFPQSLCGTQLNGALWTVAVEAQLYLLFPFLARAFQKKPILTYGLMTAVGLLSAFCISRNYSNINQMLYVNHVVTFLSVYANGMLGAWAYVSVTETGKRSKAEGLLFLMLAIGGVKIYQVMCESHLRYPNQTQWQVDYRFCLSLVFLLILFSVLMAERYLKWLLGNRVMKFLSEISFQLYIWHQFIAVKLKEFRIPYWEGETPPNQLGDKPWMWKYMILCVVLSLVVAILMTYLVEKPISKLILRRFWKRKSG